MASYSSPDSILTSAEKVPCHFRLDLPGLGILDDNPGEDVHANTPLAIPFWLATLLSVQRLPSGLPIAELDLPPSIAGSKQRNALAADPRVVDLRALCACYYDLAARVLEMWEDDVDSDEAKREFGGMSVGEGLVRAFRIRAGEIADYAATAGAASAAGGGGGRDASEGDFVARLDEMELRLFKATRDSARRVRDWMGETKKT